MTYRISVEPEGINSAEGGTEAERVSADAGSLTGTIAVFREEDAPERLLVVKRSRGGVLRACLLLGKKFLHAHAFTILYISMTAVAYGYLFIVVGVFFLQKELPRMFPEIIESFSDPYLGVLGIFVLVQEMRRRQKEEPRRLVHESFIVIWIAFLAISSVLTVLSESYHFNAIYRLIITNSLAATIIRVGAWLHF